MLSCRIYRVLLTFLELECIHYSIFALDVNTLEAKGTAALASGQFTEALSFYMDAQTIDPKNYFIVYRIATVHIAMGKLQMALPYIEMTLELNPNFIPAIQQIANIHWRLGRLEDASKTLESLKLSDPESSSKIAKLNEIKKLVDVAKRTYENKEFSKAIPILVEVLESVTLDVLLHDMLADCYLKTQDYRRGIQELRKSSHIEHNDLDRILRIAELLHRFGMLKQSYEEISQCLRTNQDHKPCRDFYKKIKKSAKLLSSVENNSENENWDQCVLEANEFLSKAEGNPEYTHQANIHICHCGSRTGSDAALEACDVVIKKDPSSLLAYFDKAEAHINLNQLEEALSVYQSILGKESDNNQAREGVKKVQRLIKQASKRDYYKILGISRTASRSEVLRAYRLLAAQYHPDRAKEKSAEKKFLDISAAKEVLSNPENRAKYDSGIDPLDSENQGGGGNPFAHGGPFGFTFQNFNPFEGGNFEFHFG